MKLGPLTTTSIGSFPRPHWLARTERNRVTFRLEGEALREAMDDATIVTLREQEEIGLDLLTDGEQRREGFIFHMTRTWDGVDLVNQAQKEIYRRRQHRAAHHRQDRPPGTRDRRGLALRQGAHGAPDQDGARGADDRDRQRAQRGPPGR